MGAYAISDSINNFTKAFKEAIDKKNGIEKERLKFEKEKFELEKEKFEFYKQQFELNELSKNNSDKTNIKFTCPHHWMFDSIYDCPSDLTRKEKHVCALCGEVKIIPIERI